MRSTLPAADRQRRAASAVGGLDGDVHRGVARADDEDVAILELVAGAVVVGMDLLARERARVAGLGPAGIPVVAVGDHHRVIGAGMRPDRAVGRHQPAAGRVGLDPRHPRVEGDRVPEPEVVDVGLEVGLDLVVAGVGRIVRRHREVGERHARARGVDLEGLVAGGLAVGVVEEPVASDGAAHLEAVEGDPRQVERLGGGQARRARSDDAHAWEGLVGTHRPGHRGGEVRLSNDVGHVRSSSRQRRPVMSSGTTQASNSSPVR